MQDEGDEVCIASLAERSAARPAALGSGGHDPRHAIGIDDPNRGARDAVLIQEFRNHRPEIHGSIFHESRRRIWSFEPAARWRPVAVPECRLPGMDRSGCNRRFEGSSVCSRSGVIRHEHRTPGLMLPW